MTLFKFLISSIAISSRAILAQAKVTQDDFTGIGHILVLNSSDYRTASPKQIVGCLDDSGQIMQEKSLDDCGTFARLNEYPYTLSSKAGNCSFNDKNTAANTDSYYGKNDHAWSCNATYIANIYDELYTITGFNYPFLCWGDIACYYDAKTIPSHSDDKIALWQYRWGSMQMDITPGHVMLQLMWNKTGDLPKREDVDVAPGPRMELKGESQAVLLQGQQVSS
ncbi:uncharacterized protein BDR25DRAFT_223245 [Lindgomyces ingoldianus]|uniref:Uncharacterized protein n=1 Tax=Lindgomyces ingoldianus TaxID=673940 RepID=A0ACB6QY92_9PLEO|nr:uncharacterized protein BDR25DRAFT_223245 [Lindgomyces ingoldianus]KAF2471171.1 hypothetical protein BDR25DRAFT_223245 [Lindgomyces ingoldianus]